MPFTTDTVKFGRHARVRGTIRALLNRKNRWPTEQWESKMTHDFVMQTANVRRYLELSEIVDESIANGNPTHIEHVDKGLADAFIGITTFMKFIKNLINILHIFNPLGQVGIRFKRGGDRDSILFSIF